jgi:hypothetical protein
LNKEGRLPSRRGRFGKRPSLKKLQLRKYREHAFKEIPNLNIQILGDWRFPEAWMLEFGILG